MMKAGQTGRPLDILLVEDSPADVLLTQEAFVGAEVHNTLHVVGDGVEAVSFLRDAAAHARLSHDPPIDHHLWPGHRTGRYLARDVLSIT